MAHLDAKTTEKASRGWSLGLLPSAVPGAYILDFLEVPPQIPFMGSLLLKGNSPGRGSRKKGGRGEQVWGIETHHTLELFLWVSEARRHLLTHSRSLRISAHTEVALCS